MKTMKFWRLAFGLWPSHLTLGKAMQASLSSCLIGALTMLAAFSLVSCSSEDEDYDVNNLAGTWERVYKECIQDAGTEQYTFFPESSYAGRIELYVTGWPNIKETKDLNYVVGHTGHMNIFTGKKHDGQSKVYGEYDIHKLSGSEMIWYRTDSNEELARFKKIK